MIRFLHTSDLHLSNREKDYSLDVFREIIQVALAKEVDFILLCGDIFDRFGDIDALKQEFVSILSDFPGPVFGIQGNHEDLDCPQGHDPFSVHLGNLQYTSKNLNSTQKAFRWENPKTKEIAEIYLFPFQKTFPYSALPLVSSSSKDSLRIALAHGSEPTISYLGPSPEEADCLIDYKPFLDKGFRYLALGHIHKQNLITKDSLTIAYCGSPRVVSAEEFGPRTVNIVESDAGEIINVYQVPIQSAGEYREIPVSIDLEGQVSISDSLRSLVSPLDYIRFKVQGIASNENTVLQKIQELQQQIACRKWGPTISQVAILPSILEKPIASQFYSLLKSKELDANDTFSDWDLVLREGLMILGGKLND